MPATVERDGATYARLAENLARGLGYRDLTGALHATFPPGYPLAAAPLVLLLGDGERAGRVVSLVDGLGVVILTYLIARRLGGTTAAVCAGTLAAIHPRLVELSTAVLSQSLYACVLYALTLAVVATLDAPRPPAARLGLGFAALACIRPEGYLVAAAALAALAAASPHGAERARRAVTFVAAMAVVAGLYSIYLWSVSGQLLTGKWGNLDLAARGERGAVPFLARYTRNVFELEGQLAMELSLLVIAVAVLGVVVLARTRAWPLTAFLGLSLVLPLAAVATFTVNAHFLAASLPLVFVFAGAAASRGRAWWAVALVGAAFLHGAPALSYPLRASAWGDVQMTEHRAMGRWILEHHGPGRRILTRAPETVYYAHGEWRLLGDVGPAGLAAEARRTGSELVVLDELLTRRYQPGLLPLLAGVPPRELRLLHELTPHPGRRIRVFTAAE